MKEKLVTGSDGGLTPGQTGWLTVGCKITLTLTTSYLLGMSFSVQVVLYERIITMYPLIIVK
jgi:hypothetical protein